MNTKRLAALLPVMLIIIAQAAAALTLVADNYKQTGGNQSDDILIQDSTNVTFINVNFLGNVVVNNSDVVVINESNLYGNLTVESTSTSVDARNNYWDSGYAPLHADNVSSGCNDGTGGVVSGIALASPWYTDAARTVSSSNCAPSLAAILDQEGNLNIEFTLQAVCTDQNAGDTLVYTDNTSLWVINASTGYVSFTPGSVISENVDITCSDSSLTDTESFLFSVSAGSGYVASYTGAAVTEVSIDFLTGIGAALVGLVTLIFMIGGYKYLTGEDPFKVLKRRVKR